IMSDELQLLIEKLVYGGDGLGHADGNTVFAPYVLPGEEIRAEITSRKKKLVWAKPLEILKANPARVKPVCPHFGTCGGGHFQHPPYQAQVNFKIEILRETPSPLGGVDLTGAITPHSPRTPPHRHPPPWPVSYAQPRTPCA